MEDIPKLLEMGPGMHADTILSRFTYSEEKALRSLEQLLSDKKGTHCLLLAEGQNQQIVGVFLGYVSDYFFSQYLVAGNLVFWVDPDHRGTPAAIKLISAFRRWAENRKVKELSINITSGVDLNRADRFLGKLGFSYTGGNYSMLLSRTRKAG